MNGQSAERQDFQQDQFVPLFTLFGGLKIKAVVARLFCVSCKVVCITRENEVPHNDELNRVLILLPTVLSA